MILYIQLCIQQRENFDSYIPVFQKFLDSLKIVDTTNQQDISIDSLSINQPEKLVISTEDFLTYYNSEFGLKFMYPNDWKERTNVLRGDNYNGIRIDIEPTDNKNITSIIQLIEPDNKNYTQDTLKNLSDYLNKPNYDFFKGEIDLTKPKIVKLKDRKSFMKEFYMVIPEDILVSQS